MQIKIGFSKKRTIFKFSISGYSSISNEPVG